MKDSKTPHRRLKTPNKITLNLDDRTFQHLEALAYGLALETGEKGTSNGKVGISLDKEQAPGNYTSEVTQLLTQLCFGLSAAVSRPGSWENGSVSSLTGWEGTLLPKMFGDLVEVEALVEVGGKLRMQRTTKNGTVVSGD